MIIAGVDVGGSGIRVGVEAADVRVRASVEVAAPRRDGHVDVDELAGLISGVLRGALADADALGDGSPVVAVGMAGIPDLLAEPARFAHTIGAAVGARCVALTGDSLTMHVGALDLAAGTVVAAGTGVAALGTDLDAVWHRVDGNGYLLGDEGGGAWIGRRGLMAALRAADGRAGGSQALLREMIDRFGPPDDVVATVHADPSPASLFGGFATAVADVARDDDPVACAIWSEAAEHLASAAVSASRDLEPVFSWGGGLFSAGALLMDPFRTAIEESRPGARFVPPAGASVDGALLLAREIAARGRLARHPRVEVYGVEA